MTGSIISAIITGGLALIGTVITVLMANHKTEQSIKVSQAITETKLEELTREVRLHNNFAQRMPVVEEQIKALSERIGRCENDGK